MQMPFDQLPPVGHEVLSVETEAFGVFAAKHREHQYEKDPWRYRRQEPRQRPGAWGPGREPLSASRTDR